MVLTATREKILDAAEQLIESIGYQALTMRTIAEYIAATLHAVPLLRVDRPDTAGALARVLRETLTAAPVADPNVLAPYDSAWSH